jgi:ribosomal protein L37AE/L43A
MKPKLIKINGIWHCRSDGITGIGLGYTPAQAYAEWMWL